MQRILLLGGDYARVTACTKRPATASFSCILESIRMIYFKKVVVVEQGTALGDQISSYQRPQEEVSGELCTPWSHGRTRC